MKFVTIRELRNRPGRIWDDLRDDDMVLTANGKPVGILVGVEEDDLESSLAALRRARALQATSRLRKQAAASGARELSARQVAAEIRGVRGRRPS